MPLPTQSALDINIRVTQLLKPLFSHLCIDALLAHDHNKGHGEKAAVYVDL